LFCEPDRDRLEAHYRCHVGPDWEVWGLPAETEAPAPRFKLYVSPARTSLDHVLACAAQVLCDIPVPAFKLARDRQAANRPDKLVIYFDGAEERRAWVERLAPQLVGSRGHGVAFTRQWDGELTLSCALDPRPGGADDKPESWRSWCTDRLGWALAVARQTGAEEAIPPVRFALLRMWLEGVDVALWQLVE
jgi:hypothetical protein